MGLNDESRTLEVLTPAIWRQRPHPFHMVLVLSVGVRILDTFLYPSIRDSTVDGKRVPPYLLDLLLHKAVCNLFRIQKIKNKQPIGAQGPCHSGNCSCQVLIDLEITHAGEER